MCAASTRRRINVVTAEQHEDDVTRRFGKAETSSLNESGPPATTTSSPTRRRMILLASTTAAERMTFANGSSFGASSEWATLNDGSAPGLASPPPSKGADPFFVRKTERLGLKYEVLASGSGNDCVELHDVVDVDYVMRRANGYFIYSNADCGIGCGDGDPERWAIADGFIETIPEMLVGAKKGEVRKFLVKPEFGYATKPHNM